MNNQLINLKNQVISAFVDHELGNPLTMSDKLYDELLAKIKEVDPNFDIYQFAPVPEGSEYVPHRAGMKDLVKEHIHDIEEHWCYEDSYHKTPKYDGSSIVIYYTNGKFSHIVSMRDKEEGIDQTDKFKSFAPQSISPSISFIRCECLVDMRLDENARGKANGLVNSKYKQEEVNELCSLMAFSAYDVNGEQLDWSEFSKLSEYNKVRENGIPYFMRTLEVQQLTYSRGVVMYNDAHINFRFAIDGIVYYEKGFAYKYDYIDSAITTITEIEWNLTEKGLLYPTLIIDPVEIGTATVGRVSSNGVMNIYSNHLGVGAVVEVARSGETIPQIISIIEGAEVVFPKCSCSHQYTIDDICGSGLICTNEDCSERLKSYSEIIDPWIEQNGKEAINYISTHLEEITFLMLNISRFNPETKRLLEESEIESKLAELYAAGSFAEFKTFIENAYHWSELQWSECYFKCKTVFKVLHKLTLK